MIIADLQLRSVDFPENSIPAEKRRLHFLLLKYNHSRHRVLYEITPLNAGKKRDEASAMLGKFFPRLESHMEYMKKYKTTIDYLTQENTSLKEEVNSEKSVLKQLDAAKLK